MSGTWLLIRSSPGLSYGEHLRNAPKILPWLPTNSSDCRAPSQPEWHIFGKSQAATKIAQTESRFTSTTYSQPRHPPGSSSRETCKRKGFPCLHIQIEEQITATTPGCAAKITAPDITEPTHGQTTENLVLATENRTHFESLLQGLQADCQPQTLQQFLFVEQLAIRRWFPSRRQGISNASEIGVFETADNDPASLSLNSKTKTSTAMTNT